MNFQEKIADYVLGNRSLTQLPDIALTGIKENLESDSLDILASMNEKDNGFEIKQYFEQMIIELNLHYPTKLDSAKILIRYYLNLMISDTQNVFLYMTEIHNNVYFKFDWSNFVSKSSKRYFGDELDLQSLYTWYRELQDLKDHGRLLYYNDLPREEQKRKFENHLLEEARNWLERN
ncbi:hypothetical protein [Sediminitomix flava]|uniref:Uncharacterized protein n=1 Tax=Sediminitomix flava TaxID=379075 RepID=A0A315YUN9_SEDFL|nr:hypothetical protein [Sediminitomix flava]PWJ32682.1 hypothetical protein BC781_1216 [Sediminitomix flava]